MEQHERVIARGDLEIFVRDEDEALVEHYAMRNTITYEGVSGIMRLLLGINPTQWEINRLSAGTNGTPPTRADTALGASVISKTLSGPNRVGAYDTGTIVYTAQIGPSEALGNILREAGLFYANNTMFSRMTHPEIDRTSAGLGVLYIWRVSFTV